MANTEENIKASEEFIREVLDKNFNQKIDKEALRSAAERFCAGMPSFQTSLTPNKRAAGRFIVGVRRALLNLLVEENVHSGITQTAIAKALGIHRSVINRELRGINNLALGRVGELAWALGFEPKLTFEKIAPSATKNSTTTCPT